MTFVGIYNSWKHEAYACLARFLPLLFQLQESRIAEVDLKVDLNTNFSAIMND